MDLDDLMRDLLVTGTAATMTTATTNGAGGDVLTIEHIRRVMRQLDENEAENQRMSMANMAAGYNNVFGGMRVIESPMAAMLVPVRKHKKRSSQSSTYHARIQKKWIKRFGKKEVACAFMLNGGVFGLGSAFVLHPSHAALLRGIA